MPQSALDRPLEIYGRFSAAETRALRRYVELVGELAESSFFKNPGNKVTITGGTDEALRAEMDYAGEESVRAVVPVFRMLYNGQEPTSFTKVRKMLAANVSTRDARCSRM